MFKWFVLLGLSVSPVFASVPAPVIQTDETIPNYCHDAAKNADWEVVIKRFPTDTVLLRLYALRRGLCSMIDEGIVSLDMAIGLFEGERKQWIQERLKSQP